MHEPVKGQGKVGDVYLIRKIFRETGTTPHRNGVPLPDEESQTTKVETSGTEVSRRYPR